MPWHWDRLRRSGQEATLGNEPSTFDLGLFGLGTLLVIATGLSTLRSARWWIRLADFPRLQLGAGLAVVLALVLARGQGPWDLAFAALLGVCLIYQGLRVLPYTPFAPLQVRAAEPGAGGPTLRLLIANVLMENRNAAALLALVKRHDPDVVFLVETDAWWAERLLALERTYSHVVRRPQGNFYGLHFFSRLPVDTVEVRWLVADDVPSVKARLLLGPGRPVDFYGLHPRPPVPGQDSDERDAEILIVGREVQASTVPSIVAGDLNDVAWSHTTRLFQRISGLVDPRRGRGMFSSFHADYPVFRWPLDHVFHDADFALVALKRLPSIGSDHFPMLVDLALAPSAVASGDAPAPRPGDLEEASALIDEGIEAAQSAGT